MRSDWFGDSYDIVKRFFVGELRSLGYEVHIDPMASGDWSPVEPAFLNFLGARHVRDVRASEGSALFLDPDTGIADRRSRAHASISSIIGYLSRYTIVFVFDQSFSRGEDPRVQILRKLKQFQQQGAYAFYYDSHARFLFASASAERLNALRRALLETGLPGDRLVNPGGAPTQ